MFSAKRPAIEDCKSIEELCFYYDDFDVDFVNAKGEEFDFYTLPTDTIIMGSTKVGNRMALIIDM